ncbi:EAL domain-containing protein [Massilia sp. LXY-6]|uniref:EAL domain-containing protein n=1 Tax=Massilia sp. LXY-6 TaxID=3379823 RepID=UPI003EE0A96A
MRLLRIVVLAILCIPWLASAAPLRVVLDENYPPFVHRTADGQLEGYTVDLWRLWEKKTGRQAELIAVNWADVQPTLASGKADVIDTIFRTEERTATLDFSKPYATVGTAVYADASIGGVHDIASLKGFEVGVQAGDACAEELRRAGVTGVRIYPNYRLLVDAAASQSIKLLCMDEYSADYRLYQLGLQRQYVKAFEVTRNGLRRAVRKSDAATLAMVEDGMARITPDELDALHDKWMGRTLPFVRYAGRLLLALLALGGLVLLLAVWLTSVRRAVRRRTAELEQEKAQLRTLVESSPDAIWLKDPDGIYLACNTRLEELVGKPRADIVGRRDEDLFAPAAAERMRNTDLEALRTGTPAVHEQRLTAPGESKERSFETIKTSVVAADGKVLGVLGVGRDVSMRLEHERTIRRQERLLTEMSALARIGAWELDPATGHLEWTDELARIYELPAGQPVTLAACEACYSAEDRALGERARDKAFAAGKPFDQEFRILTAAGTRKWVRVLCVPVTADGRTVLSGTVQDVTQRRDLEESMRMANLIYRTSSEAVVVTDEANHIVDANPAFTALTGYALDEVAGCEPSLFGSSMHDQGFYARLRQSLAANDHWQGEIHDRNKDGRFTVKFVNIRVIRHPDGRVYRHVIQFQDISEQKQKDEVIWRQTNFDSLTGLPNRRLFLDRLQQDLKKAQGAGRRLGVLLLDIDRFKDINDGYGYARGDEVLVELTRRMARRIPADATMARLGGGMFAIAVGQGEQQLHLETIAGALSDGVAAPLRLGPDGMAYLSASIGISVYPDDGADPGALLASAEHAMYKAKRAGRGHFQYFTTSLQQQAAHKLRLTNDLRMALARRQLHVYYQPIVEADTGRVRKAETLLRWEHPELGLISPTSFIPLAEETGLIDDIGEWVLGEAIASIERWRQKYDCLIELSVNISPMQFERQGKLPWLDRILAMESSSRSITVEITEGILVSDAAQVSRCLGALHGAGAKVSIDDFGTGFSSLAYLKHFDVDYLKIDKSFIDQLAEDGSDKAVTEAIIGLAHRLGIEVIAEGVEHEAQRALLAAFGCDYIQGWYYSKALPREAFEEYLERQMAY